MNHFPRLRAGMREVAGVTLAVAVSASAVSAQTLAAVKQRGALACGVSEGIYGFSAETPAGWAGKNFRVS